jgi:hypothetical protein
VEGITEHTKEKETTNYTIREKKILRVKEEQSMKRKGKYYENF